MFYLQIFALLAAIWLGIIFFFVIVRALDRDANSASESVGATASRFFRALTISIIGIVTALWIAVLAVVNHFISYGTVYVSLIFFAALAETFTYNQRPIMQAVDKGVNQVFFASVAEILLWLLNSVRIMVKSILLSWNWLAGVLRIITNTSTDIFIGCEAQDWKVPVRFSVRAFEAFVNSTINFLLSELQDDFDAKTPIGLIGLAIGSIEDSLVCQCADLSFLWEFLRKTVEDPNIGLAFSYYYNAMIEFYRIQINLLLALIKTIFGITEELLPLQYDCNEADAPNGILQRTCYSKRLPKFDRMAENICEAAQHSAYFLDNVIQNLVDVLLDGVELIPGVPSLNFNAPNLFRIVSSGSCASIYYAEIMFDSIMHADMIFLTSALDSSIPDYKFLQFIRIDKLIFYLKQVCDRMESAFTVIIPTSNDDVLDQIGCMLGSLLKMIVLVFEFFIRFFIVLFNAILPPFQFSNLTFFLRTYDYQAISTQLTRASSCTKVLASYINEQLSEFVDISFLIADKSLLMLIGLFTHIDPFSDLIIYVNGPFTVNYNEVINLWKGLAVAGGNFVRQFSDSSCCTMRNPLTQFNTSIPYCPNDFQCCLGGIVESYIQIGVGMLDLVCSTIIALVSGDDPLIVFSQNNGTPFNVQEKIIIHAEKFVRSYGCAPASFLVYLPTGAGGTGGQCFNSALAFPLYSFPSITSDLYTTVLNITVIPLYTLNIGAIAIGGFLNIDYGGPIPNILSDLTSILCTVVIGMYDVHFLVFVNILRAGGTLMACAVPDTFGPAAFPKALVDTIQVIWRILGWYISGYNFDLPNLRDIICDFLNAVADLLSSLILLLSDPDAFFTQLFTDIAGDLTSLLNLEIITPFNDAFCDIVGDINIFIGYFNGLVNQVGGIFTQYIPALVNSIIASISGITTNLRDCIECIIEDVFGSCNVGAECSFSGGISIPPAPGNPQTPTTVPPLNCADFTIPTVSVSKRDIVNGSSLTLDQIILFNSNNNDPIGNPCKNILDLIVESSIKNTSSSINMIHFYGDQLQTCLTSAYTSRYIDLFLLQLNESESIVDRKFLTNPTSMMMELLKLKSAISEVITYQFTTNQSLSWIDYLKSRNISTEKNSTGYDYNKLTIRIGSLVDIFTKYMNLSQYIADNYMSQYQENKKRSLYKKRQINSTDDGYIYMDEDPIAQYIQQNFTQNKVRKMYRFMKFVKSATALGSTVLTLFSPKQLNFYKQVVEESFVKRNIFTEIYNNVEFVGFSSPKILQKRNELVGNFSAIKDKINEIMNAQLETKNNQTRRNRVALTRMMLRVRQRILWHMAGKPDTWTDGLIPPINTTDLSSTKYTPYVNVIFPYKVTTNSSLDGTIDTDPVYLTLQNDDKKKRSLTSPTHICIGSVCTNCSWFERVVNDVIDLSVLTGEDYSIMFSGDPLIPQSSYPNNNYPSSLTNITIPTSSDSGVIVDIPDSFIFTFVNWFINLFVPSDNEPIDVREWIVKLVQFVTNTNYEDDTGSLWYWLKWSRTCDPLVGPRCRIGPQGQGLVYGFLWTIIPFGAIFVVIYLISGMLSSAVMGLSIFFYVLLFFQTWMSIAYMFSPACLFSFITPIGIPIALPMFPDCLPDDTYNAAAYIIDNNCTNFDSIGLSGLTTSICPTNIQQCYNTTSMSYQGIPPCADGLITLSVYERQFVDCSADPYNFDNPFRNAFFLLYTYWPWMYTYVTTSNHIWISWIRELPFVMEAFQFNSVVANTDTFRSCNWITGFNLFNVGLFTFVSLFVFFIFLSLIISVIALITWVLILMMSLLLVVINNAIGNTTNPDRFYIKEQMPSQIPQTKI
jgi:hypothetical protein